MKSDKPVRFEPDYIVPPGETVLETIEALGLTQADLAARTGRPKKTINEIINGKAAITPETALQFEKALGVDARFWNGLEQQYRAALARAAEGERLRQQLGWLKTLPVKALVKAKWIPSFADPIKQLEAVLSFYGVASADAWQEVWSDLRAAVSYRKARAFESDFATVTAWLRKGELVARQVDTQSYDAKAFRDTLSRIRLLTLETAPTFAETLVEWCATAGVTVCFVPELPKLRVCGATRWLNPDKPLVQLSLRYKRNDQIWFTFFHEAAHILLHGKRSVFVEEDKNSAASIPTTESKEDLKRIEDEANQFAQNLLIPPDKYQAFVAEDDFTASSIKEFASYVEIHPGIVLGRLQRDEFVPYPTPLNRVFKISYRLVDD